MAPQLSSHWQHNYSTKTRLAGWANEQSMYSLMSIGVPYGGEVVMLDSNPILTQNNPN